MALLGAAVVVLLLAAALIVLPTELTSAVADNIEPLLLAVVGMAGILGTLTATNESAQHAEKLERLRWEREDEHRRRVRAEEAVTRILEVVQDAAEKVRDGFRKASYRQGYWPPQQHMKPVRAELRRLAWRVPDNRVRSTAMAAADALYYYDPVHMTPDTWGVIARIEGDVETVGGAYLRGEEVPATTALAAIGQEIEAFHKWVAEIDDDSGEE